MKTVITGDFNGDKAIDVLLASTSGGLAFVPGDGKGGFGTEIDTPMSNVMNALVPGLLNADTHLDLIGASNSGLFLMTGDGTGSFSQPVSIFPAGGSFIDAAVGDLNGDHIPDVVAVSGQTYILLGNGDGTFLDVGTVSAGANANAGTVLFLIDFNGDQKLDLLVGSILLLGNGDGSFKAPQNTYADGAGSPSASLAVADFNGDGLLDIANAWVRDSSLSVIYGKGDGTFSLPTNYATGSNPSGVVAADFNGDGTADLAVANTSDNTIGRLLSVPGCWK